MSSYSEKLLNPKWQKKRLKILERDKFSCQCCFDSESTLHVHHMKYIPKKEPWEINDKYLVTLCADCHKNESETRKESIDKLVDIFSIFRLWGEDIDSFACDLYSGLLYSEYPPEVFLTAISKTIRNETSRKKLFKDYFKGLKDAK